jgi:hypothetical protein
MYRTHKWSDVCVLYTAKKHGPHTHRHVWARPCILVSCPGRPEAHSACARHDIVRTVPGPPHQPAVLAQAWHSL